jgi:hypothetical protein
MAELIIAFVGGGGLSALLAFILKWKQLKAKSHIKRVLSSVRDIYVYLNKALNESNAYRVYVIRIANGGTVPQIGKRLYASIIYEVYRHGLDPIANEFDNQLVDENYISLTAELFSRREMFAHTATFSRGMLRSFLKANDIRSVYASYIDSGEGYMTFFVIAWDKLFEPDDKFKNLSRTVTSLLQSAYKSQS